MFVMFLMVKTGVVCEKIFDRKIYETSIQTCPFIPGKISRKLNDMLRLQIHDPAWLQ
jgi:hypothetical protein